MIFIAVQVVQNLHRPEFLPIAFSVIVGLHFFCLLPWMKRRDLFALGILFCGLPIAYMLAIPAYIGSTLQWAVLVGFGNAACFLGVIAFRLQTVKR